MNPNEVLSRISNGDITVREVLEQLEDGALDAATAKALGKVASLDEIPSIFEAATAADRNHGTYCPTQLNVAFGLLESERLAPILEHEWTLRDFLSIAANAVSLPSSSQRDALFEKLDATVASRVEEGGEPGFHEVLDLLGIKRVIQHLSSDVSNAFLNWFDPHVRKREDNEEFYELDYPYGQVDPCIELARSFALAGRADDAIRWLEHRQQKWAQMMHFDELLDLAALVEALPESERQTWWRTMRRWAQTTDQSGHGYEGESLETEWLVRTRAPEGLDVDAALLDAVAAADLPQRLASILDCSRSDAVREKALSQVLGLAEKLLTDIVESAPDDFGRRAPAIRGLRVAAHTLDINHDELSSEQHDQVSAIARQWAAWFAGYDTQDLLPHRYTAIGFAAHWRDDVEPAAAKLRAEVEDGHTHLLTYEGWERLFSEDELAELC